MLRASNGHVQELTDLLGATMDSNTGRYVRCGEKLWNTCHFFRPTPYGFRQVVQHISKPVACEIN